MIYYFDCFFIQLNNLETRILQKKGTYFKRKQQTQFYWVCEWELMENATNLTPLALA